jgi:hypothetical protein
LDPADEEDEEEGDEFDEEVEGGDKDVGERGAVLWELEEEASLEMRGRGTGSWVGEIQVLAGGLRKKSDSSRDRRP